MKKSSIIGVGLSLLTVTLSEAATTTISVNWKQFGGAINDPTEPYGVVSASNWTNITGSTATLGLIDDLGVATSVDVSTTASGGLNTYLFGAPLDNTVLRTGLSSFSASSGSTVSLAGLNSTFSSYDIIVYTTGFNTNPAGTQGTVTDGTSTFYFAGTPTFTAALTQSTDTNPGDGIDQGTYVSFTGLTADTATIDLRSFNNVGVGIGGIQITGEAVPEPSSSLLCMLGALALVKRRR